MCANSDVTEIDNQIKTALSFFDGQLVSLNQVEIVGGEGESTEKGKTVSHNISPYITGITTNTGKKYEIRFYDYLVNTKQPSYVGISELDITVEDGSKCIVGKYLK